MKLYARLVVALGFPIAAACTLSLPLILLGAVTPDPRPWNWPTVYIVDFLYGLALFSQLVGFLCRTSRNRLWTAAVGGYTALAFGQAALEALAIVAYRQPVTRAQVAAIRGVNSDGVIRSLTVRGLIKEDGVDPESRAALLVTSEFFLDQMGLKSLDELPSLAPFLPSVAEMTQSKSEDTDVIS